MKPFKESVLNI
ncbi:Protein of unknown function [Bacillus wiedmannii]|nr:Protein of unknown function [Bacillus wiedmannii]